MGQYVKIIAVILVTALFMCACAIPDPPKVENDGLFKGKTDAEWQTVLLQDNKGTVSTSAYEEGSDKFCLRTEFEAFSSATASTATVSGSEFSGNKVLHCTGDRNPDVVYTVTYKVSVPESGPYDIVLVTSTLGMAKTTNYFIYVNGVMAVDCAIAYDEEKSFPAPSLGADSSLLAEMTFGPVFLNKGECEISFGLDNLDKIRGTDIYNFYGDFFDIKPSEQISLFPQFGYVTEPSGDFAAQATGAAEVSVYANTWDIGFELKANTFVSRSYNLSIKDFYGNEIYKDNVDLTPGANTYSLNLGKHPSGYFTFSLSDSNGTAVYEKKYVVVPDITERALLVDSPFAADFAAYHIVDDPEDAYRYACAGVLAGISLVRERCDWIYTEWDKGGYYFARPDEVYGKITDSGMKIMPFISNAPNWATDNGTFMTNLVDAYKYFKEFTSHYSDILYAVEVWNEMDWFTTEPAEMYAALYKAAALGIADSGEGVPKMFGGLCQSISENNYLDILARNDIFRYTDAFNFHYHIYDTSLSAVTEFIDGTVAGKFSKYALENVPDKPSWCTEAGIKLYYKDKSETINQEQMTVQANYLVTSTVQSLSAGTDKHFWFILPPNTEDTGNFGSFSPANEPYAVIAAEAVMTKLLGKASYLGNMSLTDAEGHMFNNGTDDVAVIWSATETQITLKTGQNVLLTDIMGNNSVKVCDDDGNITFTASPSAVFITFDGESPKDIYTPSDVGAIKAISADNSFSAGEHVVISQIWTNSSYVTARKLGHIVPKDGTNVNVLVTNLNSTEIKGTVTAAADGFTISGGTEITVPALSTVTVTLNIKPNDGAARTYLEIGGIFGGEEVSPSVSYMFPG